MFSQWKQAVENLAQHSPKPSLDGAIPAEDSAARSSLDVTASALSSLRKTLAAQRPASPVHKSVPAADASLRPRTTLEDRLRAKFVVGEASTGTSPSQSIKSSPSSTPVPAIDHPLSPAPPTEEPSVSTEKAHLSPKSVPLPESPALSGSAASLEPLAQVPSDPLSPAPSEAGPIDSKQDSPVADAGKADGDVEEPAISEPPSAPTSEDNAPSPAVQDDEPENIDSGADRAAATPPAEAPYASQADSVPTVNSASEEHDNGPATAPVDASPVVEVTPPPVADQATPSKADEAVTIPESAESSAVVSADAPSDVHTELATAEVEPEVAAERAVPSLDAVHPPAQNGPDIETLQKRLKLVEQRFSDVSTSFKRLQAEKVAADRVLAELTSVESIKEADALRDFLQNMNLKVEMAQDEIKRLNGKLTRQEERVEELRDIHRLESKSQSEQIEKLRAQVDEAEALLKASQGSTTQLEEEVAKKKAKIDRLNAETEKFKSSAKDEEEKRTKAVALLKTVRQKLVKAEKERDDVAKEVHAVKEKGREELEKERSEKQKLQEEIHKVNTERDIAIQGLKAQFDKEVTGLKDRHEKELAALRGQYELEIITTKSLHSKEIESNNARIADLEASVRILTGEKDDIFDQLQMRQAELESSQSHLESLQSQTVELQYQLREANDRIALLTDELMEARKERAVQSQGGPSTEEVTRLISSTEAKYETRIADLRRQMAAVERERDEAEALFNKRLSENAKEVTRLQSLVETSVKSHEEDGETVSSLQREIESLKEASRIREQLIADLRVEADKVTEVENAAQMQIAEIKSTVAALQQTVEESKAREAQLRAHNKTLREELRKVQSSAALLERQRNPGVGYWGSRTEGTPEQRSPTSSSTELAQSTPSRPSSPSTKQSDEEVNYEYLRNVILQFLEHKEMRPHLIRILSTILRFTPQETRRLIAKV